MKFCFDPIIVFSFPTKRERVNTCRERVFSLVMGVRMVCYTEGKIQGFSLGFGGEG
jgi:hypothetical protein